MMHLSWQDFEDRIAGAVRRRGVRSAPGIAWATVWLQACGYPAVTLLAEAFADDAKDLVIVRDPLGIDLHNVSCVYLAASITADVLRNGRAFLRNVRHGLYLVPFSVRDGLAIGCPVDPAFALGGPREKNPYTDKLAAARAGGLAIDDAPLAAVTG